MSLAMKVKDFAKEKTKDHPQVSAELLAIVCDHLDLSEVV